MHSYVRWYYAFVSRASLTLECCMNYFYGHAREGRIGSPAVAKFITLTVHLHRTWIGVDLKR
eukprot:2072757-Amphidinium_carterae.1